VSLYFLDSSALVKRYVTETGSDWIRVLTDPAARSPLIIARIPWVEVLSALARRQREGSITAGDVTRAIETFSYDLDMQYQVAEVDAALAKAAGELVIQ
jgi:predicted nucleic acid-binding protein